MAKVFLDTNVVVYAMDTREPAKQARARALIASLDTETLGVISTQVLCEAYSVATTKLGIEPLAVKQILLRFERLEVVAMTPELVRQAIDCSILNTLSIWDALIVAAAASANCQTLWTEDLNPGQVILGVRVGNPFAAE